MADEPVELLVTRSRRPIVLKLALVDRWANRRPATAPSRVAIGRGTADLHAASRSGRVDESGSANVLRHPATCGQPARPPVSHGSVRVHPSAPGADNRATSTRIPSSRTASDGTPTPTPTTTGTTGPRRSSRTDHASSRDGQPIADFGATDLTTSTTTRPSHRARLRGRSTRYATTTCFRDRPVLPGTNPPSRCPNLEGAPRPRLLLTVPSPSRCPRSSTGRTRTARPAPELRDLLGARLSGVRPVAPLAIEQSRFTNNSVSSRRAVGPASRRMGCGSRPSPSTITGRTGMPPPGAIAVLATDLSLTVFDAMRDRTYSTTGAGSCSSPGGIR